MVTVLRNVDGARGAHLCAALEGSYGHDILHGRTQNQCSQALGYMCHAFGDTHARLFPLGDGESCSASRTSKQENQERSEVMRPFFDACSEAAGMRATAARFPAGEVQILRYRAQGSAWLGANGGVSYHNARRPVPGQDRSEPGATMHMHVDNEKRAGSVTVLTLGCSATYYVDLSARCRRLHRKSAAVLTVSRATKMRNRTGSGMCQASARAAWSACPRARIGRRPVLRRAAGARRRGRVRCPRWQRRRARRGMRALRRPSCLRGRKAAALRCSTARSVALRRSTADANVDTVAAPLLRTIRDKKTQKTT